MKNFSLLLLLFILLLCSTKKNDSQDLIQENQSDQKNNCEKDIRNESIIKYLIVCKEMEVRKKYPVEVISNYLVEIFVSQKFYGDPNTSFSFNTDGTFKVITYDEKEIEILGSWRIEKNKLILNTDIAGKEEYVFSEAIFDYFDNYNLYYIEINLVNSITWAEDSAGLTAEYKEKK